MTNDYAIWDTFEERLTAKRTQKKRGPLIDLLTMLLPILLPLLQSCFGPTPPSVKGWMASNYGQSYLALMIWLRNRRSAGVTPSMARELAADIADVVHEANDAEVQAAIDSRFAMSQ